MSDVPFPLEGRTLVVGPSNAGKTHVTAVALRTWVGDHGPDGVIVFDFGPAVERDGRVLGGRLTREGAIPDGVWYGVLEAHAPRATGADEAEAVALAADNARRAITLFDAAPTSPRAAFVNDATIPFQHDSGDPRALFDAVAGAECIVVNVFESDELGTDDPVSRNERRALAAFRDWADRVVALDPQG